MRLRPSRIVPLVAVLALGATACGPVDAGAFSGHRAGDRSATATPSVRSVDDSPLSGLLPYPSGSTPWTHNVTGRLSLTAFLDNFFAAGARKDERALMVQRGFRTSVRRGWIAADRSQSDIWIITFKDADGARSMYLGLTHSWREQKTTVFADPAVHGTGQLDTTLDTLGNASAKVMSVVGNHLVYVRYYTAASPSKRGVEALAARQTARLQG